MNFDTFLDSDQFSTDWYYTRTTFRQQLQQQLGLLGITGQGIRHFFIIIHLTPMETLDDIGWYNEISTTIGIFTLDTFDRTSFIGGLQATRTLLLHLNMKTFGATSNDCTRHWVGQNDYDVHFDFDNTLTHYDYFWFERRLKHWTIDIIWIHFGFTKCDDHTFYCLTMITTTTWNWGFWDTTTCL